MQDDESSCTQMVDLETECLNVLNAEYYASKLQFYPGKGAAGASRRSVEIGKIYLYDDQSDIFPTITEQAAGTSIISTISPTPPVPPATSTPGT